MASLYREITLDIGAEHAWPALRDQRNLGRLFAGVLIDVKLDGDVRTVTFANGNVASERIVAIDDEHRRIAYAINGGRFDHYHASMQILPLATRQCRLVWICDFLPAGHRAIVEPLVDAGCAALARNLSG
jgi:hypothetical protein